MPKAYFKKKNFSLKENAPYGAIIQLSFRYRARASISLIFDPI